MLVREWLNFGGFELTSVKQEEDTGRLILCISKLKKCPYYKIRMVKRPLTEYERGFYAALHDGISPDYIDEEQSYCVGTKEGETCTCGGDKKKCNYPLG